MCTYINISTNILEGYPFKEMGLSVCPEGGEKGHWHWGNIALPCFLFPCLSLLSLTESPDSIGSDPKDNNIKKILTVLKKAPGKNLPWVPLV